MKQLLIAIALIFTTSPSYSQELYRININKVCSAIVDIPYASDNFSDEEWEQFKTCLKFIKKFKE